MKKEASFDNRDRLIQLGISISSVRRLRGLSQEQLAEKADISRSFLSNIEAPNIVQPFSIDIFFNIAKALEIDPADLLNGKIFGS